MNQDWPIEFIWIGCFLIGSMSFVTRIWFDIWFGRKIIILTLIRRPTKDFIFCQDWRVHLEQMLHIETLIESSSSLTSGKLNRIHKEITVDVEKINSREKYLNQQMSQLLDSLWKAKHDQETV